MRYMFMLLLINGFTLIGQTTSGVYGDLSIAVNDSNIYGIYASGVGGGERTCEIYFQGVLRDGKTYKIKCYSPYDLKDKDFQYEGIFSVEKDAVKLKFDSKPLGCQDFITYDKIEKRYVLNEFFDKKEIWKAIYVIVPMNSTLQESTLPKSKILKKLKRGDIVYCTGIKNGWIACVIKKNGKQYKGYIKKQDVNL